MARGVFRVSTIPWHFRLNENMIQLIEKEAQYLVKKFGTPLVVYDEKKITERVELVQKSFACDNFKLLYAIKANSNISISRVLKNLGCKVDASSPGDAFLAQEAGFKSEDIYATGPNWTNEDLEYFIENKISLDLDSVSQVRRYGQLNSGAEIGIRINPGFGNGLKKDILAGGKNSKLGIALPDLNVVRQEAEKYGLKIVGLHAHIGSSCFAVEPFVKSVKLLLSLVKDFDSIKFINIGGGYGIGFGENKRDFNITKFGGIVSKLMEKYNQEAVQKIELRTEIGEFIMWPVACAVSVVNSIKFNGQKKFVGVDINSSHIPTPQLYDSYHRIETFSQRKKEKVYIAGNLCQAGDLLAKERLVNGLVEGDIVIIQNAGAYCISRSSHFNSRLRPTEILKNKAGKFSVIRKEKLEDLLVGQIYD